MHLLEIHIFAWQLPTENKWDNLPVIDQEFGSICPATAQDFLSAAFSCLPLCVSANCAWNEKLSWRALVQLHGEPPVLEMKGFLQQL